LPFKLQLRTNGLLAAENSMLETSYFQRIKPLVFAALGLFLVFSLIDLSPRFYGPIDFMAEHGEFAPWFSGAATSLGVWVALANAHWKENRDDVRAARAARNSAIALAENACAIANMTHLCAAVALETLTDDELFRDRGHLLAPVLAGPIDSARGAILRFPIHQLPRPSALQDWYRLEMSPALLISRLEAIKALVEGKERGEDVADELEKARIRARDIARSIHTLCRSVAGELGVIVEWDFGKPVKGIMKAASHLGAVGS
jgi:hypothetical protein